MSEPQIVEHPFAPILGQAFYECDGKQLLPFNTPQVQNCLEAENPQIKLDENILRGYACLERSQAMERLGTYVDATIAAHPVIKKWRILGRANRITADDLIEDLSGEIKEHREHRNLYVPTRTQVAEPKVGERWNWKPVSLIIFFALLLAIRYAIGIELNNGETTVLGSSIDFGEDPAEQSDRARSFVFVVVVISSIVWKMIDFFLPLQLKFLYRLIMSVMGGIALCGLFACWGFVAGGGHSEVDLLTSTTPSEGLDKFVMGLFFVLQLVVFSIGNYGLTIAALYAWESARERVDIEEPTRVACNQILAPKLAERAHWIDRRESARELTRTIQGIRDVAYCHGETFIINTQTCRELTFTAEQAKRSLQAFNLVG